MMNRNGYAAEWIMGWDREPVEDTETPGDTITLLDLDEPLCNGEGLPADDCRCTF